jgi:hypothetical protein
LTIQELIHAASIANMALLVDKLRPRSLESLTYHKDLSERLASLVGSPFALILSVLADSDSRPRQPTSHTFSSSDPPALARRPASSQHFALSMVPA